MTCVRSPLPKALTWVALSILLGCTDSGSSTSSMPLAIGNTWTYELKQSGVVPRGDFTLTMNYVANTASHTYYLTNTNLSFAWTSEGLSIAIRDPSDVSLVSLEVLLRQPPPTDSYDYTSLIVPESNWHVVAYPEEMHVPAGRFSVTTYILTQESPPFDYVISFADGVGIVRLVDPFGVFWRLKSYDLADSRPGSPF